MGLIIDSLPVVFHGKRTCCSELSGLGFLVSGETPVVHINLGGVLIHESLGQDSNFVGGSVTGAVWALRTFKYNGWEVEIFSSGRAVSLAEAWVAQNGGGNLVDRILVYSGEEESLNRSVKDASEGSTCNFWFGKGVGWFDVMTKLERRGFLRRGLLPLEKGERTNDMVAMLKEPVFRDLVADLKARQTGTDETRDELIKLIENYARHPGIVNSEHDMLDRAKFEGYLLETVLRLLARDRFDPVGCIILAQQDRGTPVAQVSPLLEVDLE
jgi:hypothetical protein